MENIHLGHLEDRLHEIPRGKPLVVLCQTGARSAIAASVLRARGFDARNLEDGYAWRAAGLPIRRGAPETVAVKDLLGDERRGDGGVYAHARSAGTGREAVSRAR